MGLFLNKKVRCFQMVSTFQNKGLEKKLALASGVCGLIEMGNSHQMSSLSFMQPMKSIVNLPQLTLLSKMEW